MKRKQNTAIIEDIDDCDREYIEELLGYATTDNWKQFDKECPIEADVEHEEEDIDAFSPKGGIGLPSQLFYSKHQGSRYELDEPDVDEEICS